MKTGEQRAEAVFPGAGVVERKGTEKEKRSGSYDGFKYEKGGAVTLGGRY